MIPTNYSFPRYLAAKKSVDDRALNAQVWRTLAEHLPRAAPGKPLRVLEAGAGIGTMVERMLERGLLTYAEYTAVDAEPENTVEARRRLPEWGRNHGYSVSAGEEGCLRLEGKPSAGQAAGAAVEVRFETMDLFEFLRQAGERGQKHSYDLLVAHAFLDLVDAPAALPRLFELLRPGGMFYFTLNFDGATLLEPSIDPALDDLIEALYHADMDARQVGGKPSGSSRTGRRMFGQLRQAGGRVLAAGASDWVVFAGPDGYPEDEAYFLHFILHTMHGALVNHPQLAPVGGRDRFGEWMAERQAQVERGELVYVAHQLDFVGKIEEGGTRTSADERGEEDAPRSAQRTQRREEKPQMDADQR